MISRSAACGSPKSSHVLPEVSCIPPLGIESPTVCDRVDLEKVDEREGRSLLLKEHGADFGSILVMDADGTSDTTDPGSSVQPRVATVEQIPQIILLRPVHRSVQ